MIRRDHGERPSVILTRDHLSELAMNMTTDTQRTPEELNAENELICEKLLGWIRCLPGSKGARHGCTWSVYEDTPSFTTWAEAGLILDALQAMAGWESARACSQFGWLLKTRELTPLAIRAEALEYIRRQA